MRYLAVLGGAIAGSLVLGSIAAALVAGSSRGPALPVTTLPAAADAVGPAALIAAPEATAAGMPLNGAPMLPPAMFAVATPSPAPAPSIQLATPHLPNRLVIPTLGIDSSWVPLGYVPGTMVMDSPATPGALGWYSFTGQPGGASNAVFAGHVDWHTGAPAIFAKLSTLAVGAEIDVARADGVLVRYRVVSSTWYSLRDATSIIAPTGTPSVTLITCGGEFNPTVREYDQRLVVRAVADLR